MLLLECPIAWHFPYLITIAISGFLQVFQASPQLASIRSVDEAVVIGVALSLSSSAFVLQLLNERGEMSSTVGSATLGILLMQVRSPHSRTIAPLCEIAYATSSEPAPTLLMCACPMKSPGHRSTESMAYLRHLKQPQERHRWGELT